MDVAMFQAPFTRPERSAAQVFDWAVRQAIVADDAGFTEYWVGEHATLKWESIPSPELVISAAARHTKNITFAPGAHLLPYHHPGTLAIQTAWMSHVLEGRYILGVGAGAYPSDAAMRGITDISVNHEMLYESIELMEMLWAADGPFHHEGKFWSVGYPEVEPGHEWRDHRPYGGKMTIGMTALSANSASIKFAGSRGYLPLSVYAGNAYLLNHIGDYKNAAEEAGLSSDRSVHHVVRDVFVAETDAQAKRLAIQGVGKAWEDYLLPTYRRFGVLQGLIHDPDNVSMEDVDLDYLAEHVWLVGSPETVTEKLQSWCDELGGPFGTLIVYSHDYIDNPEPWEQSMHLLANEVAPKIDLAVARPA
jgi:alkanesulfonate monooxygenase SsuD/methylene tetrahydromethanopterin reductase-like flavin-dependent oxidoreductase (luciferase family)